MNKSKTRSASLKGIEVVSLEELVERVMERIPHGSFDLGKAEQRARFRLYIERSLGYALDQASVAIQKTALNAVAEVVAVMKDPDLAATRKANKQRRISSKKVALAHREVELAHGKRMRVQ